MIESRIVNYDIQKSREKKFWQMYDYKLNQFDEYEIYPNHNSRAVNNLDKCALLFVIENNSKQSLKQYNYRGVVKLNSPTNNPGEPTLFLSGFKKATGVFLSVVEKDLSLTPYTEKFYSK